MQLLSCEHKGEGVGKLTTHVLDTAQGKPAQGVGIQLRRVTDNASVLVTTRTNADGRCDAPLLQGEALTSGIYELDFHLGAYFSEQSQHELPAAQPPFLDVVTIRFGVADGSQNYHVPLVASPWSYSTYRGS